MSHFHVSARNYMTSPLLALESSEPLEAAHRIMNDHDISAVPVLGAGGRVEGLLRRSDLLRVGAQESGRRPEDRNLILPQRPVSDEMTRDVPILSPDATLADVARLMVEKRTHRVILSEGEQPVGIVTTQALMRALQENRAGNPISEFMSKPVFTVRAEEPVSLALDRLERAKITGLVVVENGWPVGVFTQREALAARDLPRSTPVEEVMSSRMLSLQPETRVHRAAAQAAATRVRRVIVLEGAEMVGILTGLDFARALL
jgi:CBS domain-containing protein